MDEIKKEKGSVCFGGEAVCTSWVIGSKVWHKWDSKKQVQHCISFETWKGIKGVEHFANKELS